MLKISEIIKTTEGKLIQGSGDAEVCGISTDTRTVKKGELFIAIKGQNYDGHNFAQEAAKIGAKAVLVERQTEIAMPEVCVIRVKDTRKAYGDLANLYRKRFSIPFVGITGSNGKTTTKEMLAAVLSEKYKVHKNKGTHNNDIGVPSTILDLKKGIGACVVELGTNHFGEIKRLSEILRPDIGIITNVGLSHIEFLKDLNGVLKEKSGILCGMDSGGTIILNADDKRLAKIRTDCRKLTFGIDSDCDFKAEDIKGDENGLRFKVRKQEFTIAVLGYHNIYNALAAISCAKLLGLEYGDIKRALSRYSPQAMRMECKNTDGILVINDAYNSNPFSLKNAIDTLSGFNEKAKRILVVGDMLELGTRSGQYHYELGVYAAQKGIDYIIGMGRFTRRFCMAARDSGMDSKKVFWFSNHAQCADALLKIAQEGDVVLVKGSRAMRMEEVLECFTISYTR